MKETVLGIDVSKKKFDVVLLCFGTAFRPEAAGDEIKTVNITK